MSQAEQQTGFLREDVGVAASVLEVSLYLTAEVCEARLWTGLGWKESSRSQVAKDALDKANVVLWEASRVVDCIFCETRLLKPG
jgi:hypothetical protein